MGDKQGTTEQVWQGDHLGRQSDAILLDAYISGLRASGRLERQSFVLNLDAGWGRGKTFFLSRWSEQLRKDNFRVAYVDAWATDYADDPLLAVVSEIEKAIPAKGKGKTTAKAFAKTGAKAASLLGKTVTRGVVKFAVGDDGIDLLDQFGEGVQEEGLKGLMDAVDKLSDAAGARLVAAFEQGKRTSEKFKEQLQEAVRSGGYEKPLIVIIDELDRCRPTYAVAMLERIKHWFDVPNVVFVVATDTGQLRHAITAIYGAGFDGKGYLQRFFDRTYRFAEPDATSWIAHLFEVQGIDLKKLSSPFKDDHAAFVVAVARTFGLGLRDIERCFEMMRTATMLWKHPFKLQTLYLLPLIVAYVQGDDEWWSQLVSGGIDQSVWNRVVKGKHELEIKYFGNADHSQKTSKHAISGLLQEFLNRAKKPLPNISRRDDEGASEWIVETFREEFRLGHGNRHFTGREPMSAISEYPELVRSVARFERPQQVESVA